MPHVTGYQLLTLVASPLNPFTLLVPQGAWLGFMGRGSKVQHALRWSRQS